MAPTEHESATVEDRRAALTLFEDELPDIEERLGKWLKGYNLLDVLAVTGRELQHSAMLAWLIDPAAEHGLGDRLLRLLLLHGGAEGAALQKWDTAHAGIQRERSNIDILAVARDNHEFVLAIENKVWSSEHGNQLARYRNLLRRDFPGAPIVLVFLTPEGRAPENDSDCEWIPLSYGELVSMIEAVLREAPVDDKTKWFIGDYLDAVRRTIVGDPELVSLCEKIYRQHRKVLDLLMQNIPNDLEVAARIVGDWFPPRNRALLDEAASMRTKNTQSGKGSKMTYRFLTENLAQATRDPGGRGGIGWGSDSGHRCYEVFLEVRDAELFVRPAVTFYVDNMPASWTAEATAFLRSFADEPGVDEHRFIPGTDLRYRQYSQADEPIALGDEWEERLEEWCRRTWQDFEERETRAIEGLKRLGAAGGSRKA